MRPAWDVILIALMLGGFGVSATGVYLALRRVRSDLVVIFRAVAGVARHRPNASNSHAAILTAGFPELDAQ